MQQQQFEVFVKYSSPPGKGGQSSEQAIQKIYYRAGVNDAQTKTFSASHKLFKSKVCDEKQKKKKKKEKNR